MKYFHSLCSFLILCFLLSGCDAFDCEHDQPITEGLDQWAPYHSNEEVHFKTAALVDEYLDVKLFERIWENADTDCTDDIEYIQVYLTARNSFQDSLSINIRNNAVHIEHEADLDMTYIEGAPSYSTSSATLTYHSSMDVGGQSLSNVFVISCNSCDELTEIKFSKTFGIVEFTANGLVYTRVF